MVRSLVKELIDKEHDERLFSATAQFSVGSAYDVVVVGVVISYHLGAGPS